MKTSNSQSLKSFEQLARTSGLGSLVVGALLLVGFWVGGHGALYGAYRVTETHPPATVVAQAE